MQRKQWMLGCALCLAAGIASAALPPLAADSAELDRSYIPALMLSNGKDPARARAAQDAYEAAWQQFAARQRSVYAADPAWRKTLATAEHANGEARTALAAGRLQDAHNAQEEVRHALWHQRQAMGVAYQPDALTDFHATMEVIIASVPAPVPAALDAGTTARLRDLLTTARTQWKTVVNANWSPDDYGLTGARLDAYRTALLAETQALDALAGALDAGEGTGIGKAATSLKPPFAKAYGAFGVFPP
jgi:hypothetical protein